MIYIDENGHLHASTHTHMASQELIISHVDVKILFWNSSTLKCLECGANFMYAYGICELVPVLKEIMTTKSHPQGKFSDHNV
jgi:hypothetical protein